MILALPVSHRGAECKSNPQFQCEPVIAANPSLDVAIGLCNKILLLCREAGEGELDYGFMILAGETQAVLTRIFLVTGDLSSAQKRFKKLGPICEASQNYRLLKEYQTLESKLS